MRYRIGVISDTHGLLRPQARQALAGSDLIIHAGDIGKPQVLEELGRIAPVRAVRGNNDRDEWATTIPERDIVEIGGARLYLLHNLKELEFDPASKGFSAVIAGHSHKPLLEKRGEVLYLNPGAAGPRRFKLPISLAVLLVEEGRLDAQLVELTV